MSWVRRQSSGRADYLFFLFLIPAAASLGHYVAPDRAALFGQDFGIVAGGLLSLAAGLTWLFFRGQESWPWPVRIFLMLLLVTWVYQILRMRSDEMAFNYGALIVPVAVSMIWLKSVCRNSLQRSLLILGYSLAAIAVVSFILGEAGFFPSGFNVSDGAGATRFTWLDALGIETRWGGPWTSVNRASAIGGLLLVIGAVQQRWHRILLMTVGAAVLMLGGSRAALMAAGVSLLILLLTQSPINNLRHRLLIRVVATAGLVALLVAYIAIFDPTLALRTPVWSYFLDLVPQAGLFGVVDAEINTYVNEVAGKTGLIAHTDPHNIYLDWLVRYGWLMVGLSLGLLSIAGYLATKAAVRGTAAPIAVLAYILIYGLADTILSWIYWSAFLVAIVWSVLFAARVFQASQTPRSSERADRATLAADT